MIIAFADDGTVQAFDSFLEVLSSCELQDVETGVYVFCDETGRLLKPIFEKPPVGWFQRLGWHSSFTLQVTERRDLKLLQSIISESVTVRAARRIKSREELLAKLNI